MRRDGTTTASDRLGNLDTINTGIEVATGSFSGLLDENLRHYPNAPKVGMLTAGVLSKAATGLTVALEAGEVLSAAADGDPATHVGTQVAGAITSTASTAIGGLIGGAVAGLYSGAVAGSAVPGLGTAIGAVVGAIAGGFAGVYLEGYVEGAIEAEDTPTVPSVSYMDLAIRARLIPDSVVADFLNALARGDTVAAARAAARVSELSADRIIRVAAGYEGADTQHGGGGINGDVATGDGPGFDNTGAPVRPGTGPQNSDHGGTGNSGGQTGSGLGNNTTGAGPGYSNSNTTTSGTGPQNGGNSAPPGPGEISDGPHFGAQPILLDLNGNGIQIADLSKSTQFIDAGGDGLQHRSAWAAAGDGVLFVDADGDGKISDRREYVFTDWAPGASDDMEALRAAFDSNGDGKLTAADARFNEFRVLVTNADGFTTVQTLGQLGNTGDKLPRDVGEVVGLSWAA